MKVGFFDKYVLQDFYKILSFISVVTSLLFIFIDIPKEQKHVAFLLTSAGMGMVYIFIFLRANYRNHIELQINNTIIEIKSGDIFQEENALKVIAFNEYFDTIVDDIVIARTSLNGIYINKFYRDNIKSLDSIIDSDLHLKKRKIKENKKRDLGKTTSYKLGTICVVDQYLLTALTHFDSNNKANLDFREYITFLFEFWEEIDRVYAGKTVVIPLLGSGMTRFNKCNPIPEQDLLELLIWSFKFSHIKLTDPARVKIIIHSSKLSKVCLHSLKSFED